MIERKLHLKGRYKGKFIGKLDSRKKSVDARFYDLEVMEGKVTTRLADMQAPSESDPGMGPEQVPPFLVRMPGETVITLEYLDGTVKHFKAKLREVKLINFKLLNQVHQGDKVYGTIEGDLMGYVLHHESITEQVEQRLPAKEKPVITNGNVNWRVETSDNGEAPFKGPLQTTSSWLNFWKTLLILFMALCCMAMTRQLVRSPGTLLFSNLLISWIIPMLFRWIFTMKKSWGWGIMALLAVMSLLLYASKKMPSSNGPADTLETAQSEVLPIQSLDQSRHTGDSLYYAGEYSAAISPYSEVLRCVSKDTGLLYRRAQCYVETNQLQRAVDDLKKAMTLDCAPARLLYEKINPEKTRVKYYMARCMDGTLSDSKHRQGTCSHHGGVKEWNVAVTESYREFE